jgi:hypothetical protein
MIWADFLAGANLENGNPDILLTTALRLFRFLPITHQQRFLETIAAREFPPAQTTAASA